MLYTSAGSNSELISFSELPPGQSVGQLVVESHSGPRAAETS